MDVLAAIKKQIDTARTELRLYPPPAINWHIRAKATADALIPWLARVAPELRIYVQDVLNAPTQLRTLWAQIKAHVQAPAEQVTAFERQLALDDVLRESVTGEVVSKVVTKYLIDSHPEKNLHANGRSDYPDLYRTDVDYTGLPAFTRKKEKTQNGFGAALKGKQKRPVRVPDGLEIKTCRERIAVDCHHPHPGLHLVLVFAETNRLFIVNDVHVGFLRRTDYHEAERNTTATTVKYSFGEDRFVSLFDAA